jgi:CheY-like chemotaxis protein
LQVREESDIAGFSPQSHGQEQNQMIIVICNAKQRSQFKELLSFLSPEKGRISFVTNATSIKSSFLSRELEVEFVLVEADLHWTGERLRPFFGIDVAMELRRRYYVKAPIIFFSVLMQSELEEMGVTANKLEFLNSKGIGFISFPWTAEDAKAKISTAERLTDSGLHDVVTHCCDLKKEWRLVSHKIGTLLNNDQEQIEEVQRLVDEWAKSIDRFAPEHGSNVTPLQNLLSVPRARRHQVDLRKVLEKLDAALQGTPLAQGSLLPNLERSPPRCPPKGFSKVLVADDESQGFLCNALRNQFGYNVIKQANTLSQAKALLNSEKPDVILSDYYFKESSRKTEQADKSIGDKFIQYALTHPHYADTNPRKPIVLVTSKAVLRTDTDIRSGAINCSGANRATDPRFLHGVIWEEARKRGVSEPELVLGQEWTLELTCRQILEQYKEDLPKLIKQWGEFKGSLRDTLRLCRLLYRSASDDDPAIVNQAINALEPYETVGSFSLDEVVTLFTETESVHRRAHSPADSLSKQTIRNILHGRIEQFSSVSNTAKFMLSTLPEVARDLVSLPQHEQIGRQLLDALEAHSHSEPLLPFLTLLNETLAKALSGLPDLAFSLPSSRPQRVEIGSNNINIVVVEDNEYWTDYVVSAIEKAQTMLGENFSISYQHFDNAAEALASIPSTSKSFAIDGSDQNETKTIAIVDICLPENKDHAHRIRAALEGRSQHLATPSRTHGLNLIRALCSYNYNVPLIVYSTIDSIGDRRTIGALGVPDDDFLAKGIDGDNAIVRALIRKIEKPTKYVIRRFEEESGDGRFWINGVVIPFSKELGRTFSALYTLRQTTGRNEFSVTEIASARGDSASEEAKNVIQDQMYRIRSLILETLRSNRIYVNVRELIRTRKGSSDEYRYQLNAEVMRFGEEEDYETDLQQYESDVCKVLVIENNPQSLGEIIEPLESLGYQVKYATNLEDAVRVAMEFLPHVISLDLQIRTKAEAESPEAIGEEFAGLDAWKQIRTTLSSNTIGIVVPTVNADKNHLVARAAQMEIPIRNFISKLTPNWHNLLLKKVADEKRRVFLGEITDASQDINEPIVEILDGSDLSEGVLRLIVNSEPFTMKKSPLAKIIGLLLTSPKTLRSFEAIKTTLDSGGSVTKDDSKNWTKRIRGVIKKEWLKSSQDDVEDLAKKILESSVQGLRLNVHVIDSRNKFRKA